MRRNDTEASDGVGDLDGFLHDALAFFGQAADESPLGGLDTGNSSAGQDHIHGSGFTDQGGQALRTARSGDDAESDLRLGEFRFRRAEENVTKHRKLTSASKLL